VAVLWRYLTTGLSVDAGTVSAPAIATIQSNTITLPNIPDYLLIYLKPTNYADSTQGDWSLPVQRISMNFDNFSGLLANQTQQQLYKMSVDNGVDMDFSEWTGLGQIQTSWAETEGPAGSAGLQGGFVSLVGGPLVLRPGRDFSLQAGQAPGLVGNFQLQFDLTVANYGGAKSGLSLYVVTINSGFFETIKGSSRIIKGVLTEQDILSAPASAPEPDLDRPVGAARSGPMSHSKVQHSPMGMGGGARKSRAAMAYM
jgi:hypothetical protein